MDYQKETRPTVFESNKLCVTISQTNKLSRNRSSVFAIKSLSNFRQWKLARLLLEIEFKGC
jgi:hypothetical protein